ncbi:Hypothetical protein CINCED_3A021749 [Cinara cedri]|uniref:Uncharacterized protein n=1 Tax=Cinara cedri TaxID=506608 RepID=A0A5E4NHU2_9HEMI|nr:Hypothetical protein CINCED_3A021749 [Cinara cedri]
MPVPQSMGGPRELRGPVVRARLTCIYVLFGLTIRGRRFCWIASLRSSVATTVQALVSGGSQCSSEIRGR